ncbi:unnamed protein product, partial [Prorocentrum cordatum]
ARIDKHIQVFLRCLSQADQKTASGSAQRLQQKLTVGFIRELWREMALVTKSEVGDLSIARAQYAQVIEGRVGAQPRDGCRAEDAAGLQEYETAFMLRIFDRADTRHRGRVHIGELVTALVLASPELDRYKKVALLFEVFDLDCGNCMTVEQAGCA